MKKNFNCRQKVLIENKIDSIDYTKHIYLKLTCFYIIIEIFRFFSCTDKPKQWAVDCPSPISVRRCIRRSWSLWYSPHATHADRDFHRENIRNSSTRKYRYDETRHNLFLRLSPRSETELDRDGVFLRSAFEREKKFGAPKAGPHDCNSRNSRAKASALKREATASV